MTTQVAMEILGYFLRNRCAADTLEGIARWRLMDQVIHRELDQTRAALDWLVRNGCVLRTPHEGSQPIFRLNPERVLDSERTLASHSLRGAQDSEMPSLTIDSMNNAALWTALAPDGVTPSTELSLTVVNAPPRANADATTARVSATATSLNHTLRRTFTAVDLTSFDELRLWVYSNRPADGAPSRPLFLELRLASAALPFSAPGNTWRRLLPVSQAGVWEPLRFSIANLPAAIRSAVTDVQFRSVLDGASFQCYIDDLIAVLDHMIADVDAALLSRLDNVLSLGGASVRAVLHPANSKLNQARPYIEITNYDIVFSRERTESVRPRTDYTAKAYSLAAASNAWELFYQVIAVADDRNSQARMLEFVLRALPARGELPVNGFGLPIESVTVDAEDQLGGFRTDAIPLFYRISRRQDIGTFETAAPVTTVVLEGDVQTPP